MIKKRILFLKSPYLKTTNFSIPFLKYPSIPLSYFS